ncbi:MAG: 50S ribosomal protein L18 [Nitrospirota bacterium]|nr:50S ribosomal protein L18 [Nitrospirota bacterium]MDH5767718.1 50S ribosomal protein L18 [Nitrospirota bacterium]
MARSKKEGRERRCRRIRKKVFGNPERLRLSVYRSLNNMYAQIIDDFKGYTIISASSLNKDFKNIKSHRGNITTAKLVGELLAKRALEKGIKKVVFDRGGYLYHGRVKALAEAAREAGLEF